MATEKKIKGVIIPRHDIAKNWAKAVNFVPNDGELIIFSKDSAEDLARGYYLDDKGNRLDSVTINGIIYPVSPSDIVRFKFGNGTDNVNVLPFATTENSGGGEGGLTEDEVLELIKEHADIEAAAIVYLNTQEHIGRTLELQDVYPIQAYDTKLQIISKNRFKYTQNEYNFGGIKISTGSNGISVTGKATESINAYRKINDIDIATPGKYTISVDNDGVNEDTKKCYITYSLIAADGETIIKQDTKLSKNIPTVIDTKEFNCAKIRIRVYIYAEVDATFNTSASQSFKVQVESGEVATSYTPPKDETNLDGKAINIFGRNLYNSSLNGTSFSCDGDITINATTVSDGRENGIHYVKGVMNQDNIITMTFGSESYNLNVPLLRDDKFTFIYVYKSTDGVVILEDELLNIQIVYGHVDYSEYEPFEMSTTISDSNGICDISNIKYPYSFLALEDTTENVGYTIYLSYDPALSRNWTETQLNNIDKRLDAIEDGNIADQIETNSNKVSSIEDTTNPEVEYPSVKALIDYSVGRKTTEGGEIFNDYENNKATGEFSHAEGTQTIAGTYAFNILTWNETNKTYTLDSVEGLEVEDVFSIKWNTSHINYGKITAIDAENNTITVDNLIINSEDFETKKLFVIDKPNVGTSPFDEAAHAEGSHTQAVLYASHAEGGETQALDRYAHAEGRDTQAGYSAHSEGRGTRALGEMSHAEGGYTESLGQYSHAEGYKTQALSEGSGKGASHAEGGETIADGQRSHAEGSLTVASGYAAHAEGEQATSGGQATHAEGFNTFAKQGAAHAEGWATEALGMYSHSEGYRTLTSEIAIAAHAEGGETKALAQYAHAEGNKAKATGNYSHAEGTSTKAEGFHSHAEGNNTTASGQSSHTEGELSDSTALASHAEGYDTTASGAASHSEGTRTVASGERAHAEGGETVASGRMSHAEGDHTVAEGESSHAEGGYTTATGKYSHAGGLRTKATAQAQTAIGKYNDENKSALFIVGNGTSNTNRKNGFVVREEGYAEVESTGPTDNSVVTKAYVDNRTPQIVVSNTQPTGMPAGTIWIKPKTV